MHMPCTTTSDCRLSPAYAQDQSAHERVLARLDDCLNPQRAKRTLECSPSAPQSARREARRWMVTTLVQPRTSSAVADAGGAMGAACRKRETRSSAEEEVEALRCGGGWRTAHPNDRFICLSQVWDGSVGHDADLPWLELLPLQ